MLPPEIHAGEVNTEKKQPIIAFCESNLIFLVHPGFYVDSMIQVEKLDTVHEGNHVSLNYKFDHGQLTEAHGQITGRGVDIDAEKQLNQHFDQFKPSHFQSKNFHTWIFDLSKRPIIELNALLKTDTIDVEIFLRQHI